MNVREQITKADKALDKLFVDTPLPPPGATVMSLWEEILRLKKLVRKPKVEAAVRLLLEDPTLHSIPIGLMADLIKNAFERRGFTCNIKEASVRWYISQRTVDWSIVKRAPAKVDQL